MFSKFLLLSFQYVPLLLQLWSVVHFFFSIFATFFLIFFTAFRLLWEGVSVWKRKTKVDLQFLASHLELITIQYSCLRRWCLPSLDQSLLKVVELASVSQRCLKFILGEVSQWLADSYNLMAKVTALELFFLFYFEALSPFHSHCWCYVCYAVNGDCEADKPGESAGGYKPSL